MNLWVYVFFVVVEKGKLQYFEQQNTELNEELDELKATISEQNNKVIVDFEVILI